MSDRNFYNDHRVRAGLFDRAQFIEERGRPFLVVETCDDEGYERELRLPAPCGGRRVEPVVNDDIADPDELRLYYEDLRARQTTAAQQAAERAMGA